MTERLNIIYRQFEPEKDLSSIMTLVGSELSEPYVIYTYRYFLAFPPAAKDDTPSPQEAEGKAGPSRPNEAASSSSSSSSTLERQRINNVQPIGVIVCRQEMHRRKTNRGYIAMLSVNKAWRKRGIASELVRRSVEVMRRHGADEVVLETESDNDAALSFYASMGFMREKRLFRFYMNGKDAFRLVLPLDEEEVEEIDEDEDSDVEGAADDQDRDGGGGGGGLKEDGDGSRDSTPLPTPDLRRMILEDPS